MLASNPRSSALLRLNLLCPWLCALLLATSLPLSLAQAQTQELDEVIVSMPRPGPELWRVSKTAADGQTHEMWVLGSISPMPRKMRWESGIVEEKIRTSDAVLMPTNVVVDVKIGIFSGMLLIPKALSARNNPEKQTLQQLLPADVYQRWLVAKRQYLGRNRSIERKRPIFAARQLFEKAIRKSGLQEQDISIALVEKTAKRHKRLIERPNLKFTIEDPKQMLNEVKNTTLADGECFEQTLHFVEHDLITAKQRAAAWADGELLTLKQLPLTNFRSACNNTLIGTEMMTKRGISDVDSKRAELWLSKAEELMRTHKQTFALLPMRDVVEEKGLLQKLAARGYTIELPKELRQAESSIDASVSETDRAATQAAQ